MDALGKAGPVPGGNDADQEGMSLKQAASAEINDLIADVEDLVARIADLDDADVAKLRSRVVRALDGARGTLAGRAENLKRQAQRAAATADGYVRESPWAAVGIAALVGAVVGIIATRRS
jgi:ElaB/YqjD/DUF883 family membrane-anchored ribosome-binding protein